MNTQKAAYWISLLLFAFVLHSQYQHGAFPALHRVADRAGTMLCRTATHAGQKLAAARVLLAGSEQPEDEFLARRQAQVDRLLALRQAELNRALALHRAELDRMRLQMEHARFVMDRAQLVRMRGLERMHLRLNDVSIRPMVLACPETGARIVLGRSADLPDLDVDFETQ